jgi:PKD repeat protein
MRTRPPRSGSALVAALLGLGLVGVVAGPAAAAAKRPTVKFASPVCVSGFDVSVVGATLNWRSGPVGTVAVNWGDTTSEAASFPAWHTYASAGTYTVTLTATNSLGSGTAESTVNVGANAATCRDTVSPQPVAESGTLSGGQSVQATVAVTNGAGKHLGKPEAVWLSFAPAPGGGTATACCTAADASVSLSATPVALTTGSDEPAGEVLVTYTLPAAAPDSGSDVITASPVPNASDSGSASTSYTYSSGPVPFTPPASIASDCSSDVSGPLGAWLRGLPSNATVDPPANACYQVDEGLSLKFPVGLTIDGGTYQNLSTAPAGSSSSGTQRGDPDFNVLGGSGLTLENMTIEGVNPGGYLAKMAFASGIQLQGTQDATISDVTITATYGDGITLDPLRNASDHKGSGILSAVDNATISDVTINGAGRMGISFVSVGGASVPGASVSDVSISNVGLDTFDVEADQGNEGSQNVTINGCTASTTGAGDFFADGGAGSGKNTGNITVENCTMDEAQAGTALWVDRPSSDTSTNLRGPFLFENDTFECGTSTTVSCVMVSGGNVTVSDSSLDFAAADPAENVYTAAVSTTLTFDNDDVTGYGAPGTADSTSTVTITGGTWTPAG